MTNPTAHQSRVPSCKDIAVLLAYNPRLATWAPPYAHWVIDSTIPYPEYTEPVKSFFRAAGEGIWFDYHYEPGQVAQIINDDQHIANANLMEIKTLLTYCVRGERFTTGHWENMLTHKRIKLILARLQIIYNEVCST